MTSSSKEIWKHVVGYEGLYSVSNSGKVYRHPKRIREDYRPFTQLGKLLKPYRDRDGYLRVALFKGTNKKVFGIHRLVAEAFIPNPNEFPVVNHKDEVKHNNSVTNLEWATIHYNDNYGNRNKKISEGVSKQVVSFNPINGEIKVYRKISDVAKDGFNPTHVSSCCTGRRKHHRGLKWYRNIEDIEF